MLTRRRRQELYGRKNSRRKATPEQVAAMNRELSLRGVTEHLWILDAGRRLRWTRVEWYGWVR